MPVRQAASTVSFADAAGAAGAAAGAGAAGAQPLDYVQKWQSYWPLFVVGVLFSTPLPARLFDKIRGKWTGAVCVMAVLAVSVYYMTVSANNPFLYFSF